MLGTKKLLSTFAIFEFCDNDHEVSTPPLSNFTTSVQSKRLICPTQQNTLSRPLFSSTPSRSSVFKSRSATLCPSRVHHLNSKPDPFFDYLFTKLWGEPVSIKTRRACIPAYFYLQAVLYPLNSSHNEAWIPQRNRTCNLSELQEPPYH